MILPNSFKAILFWLLFFSVGNLTAQTQKFAIQTNSVGNLMIEDKTTGKYYPVPEFRQSSGGYLVDTKNASQTYIHNTAQTSLKIRILSLNENKSSKWIEIAADQKVNLHNSINNNNDNSWWDTSKNLWSSITSFFSDSRNGSAKQGKEASLKTGRPYVVFKQGEHLDICQLADLNYEWTTNKTIDKVVLKSTSGEKIWCQKNYKDTSFNIAKLSKRKKRKLKRGQTYHFQVHLKDGSLEYREFYYYTMEEYEQLKNFVGN